MHVWSFVEGDGLLLDGMTDFCFPQQGVREADIGVEFDAVCGGCGIGALSS